MRRPTAFTFLVTTAAGAALAAIGVTLAAAATSGGHPAVPPRYTKNSTGYVTDGGWRFRYIQTSLRIPACQADPADNAGAAISLVGDSKHLASIAVVCGGGAHSIGYFDRHQRAGSFRLSPSVGDVMTIGIYHTAGHDYFSATDTTTGAAQTVAATTQPAVVYHHAALLVSLHSTTVHVPASDVRLWSFTNALVTSYSGERGTLSGPWATRKLVATSDGTAAGTVVMSPSGSPGKGQSFAAWLRH
jgi:hypothetical protein